MHMKDANGRFVRPSIRSVLMISFVLLAIIATAVGSYVAGLCRIAATKTVTLQVDGTTQAVETIALDVAHFLDQQMVVLGSFDAVEPKPEEKLYDGAVVTVTRAVPLTLIVGGERETVYSADKTVADFLYARKIEIGEFDDTFPAMTDPIVSDMMIIVDRVVKETVTETVVVPSPEQRRPNGSMQRGETRVVSKGKEGSAEVTLERTIRNGVEESVNELSRKVLVEATPTVVEYGTYAVLSTSRGDLRYSKVLDITCTAYDLGYASCGKYPGDPGYGITASGMRAQRGVVSVDPKVIPLGTRLYVEAADGKSWCYGYAVAGDTGGNIKGYRMDLFMETNYEAIQFGRRAAKVYILE